MTYMYFGLYYENKLPATRVVSESLIFPKQQSEPVIIDFENWGPNMDQIISDPFLKLTLNRPVPGRKKTLVAIGFHSFANNCFLNNTSVFLLYKNRNTGVIFGRKCFANGSL